MAAIRIIVSMRRIWQPLIRPKLAELEDGKFSHIRQKLDLLIATLVNLKRCQIGQTIFNSKVGKYVLKCNKPKPIM